MRSDRSSTPRYPSTASTLGTMSINDSGHLHNLNNEQTIALAAVWYGLLSEETRNEIQSMDRRSSVSSSNSSNTSANSGSSFGFASLKRALGKTSAPSAAKEEDKELKESREAFERLALIVLDQARFEQELLYACAQDDPDMFVLRFLRARKWEVKRARQMLVKAIVWRHDFGVQKIMADPENVIGLKLMSLGQSHLRGYSLGGSPIAFSDGSMRIPGVFPFDNEQKNLIFMLETSRRLLKPELSEMGFIVFDFSNWTTKNQDLQFPKFLISTLEAYYPESLSQILIVEAPTAFQLFWKIIRPWLDEIVRGKIAFVKKSECVKFISADLLPVEWGGTSTYKFEYIKSTPEEDASRIALLGDKEGAAKARQEWFQAGQAFFAKTNEWAEHVAICSYNDSASIASNDKMKQLVAEREAAKKRVQETFAKWKPWALGPSHYSRSGALI